MFVNSAFPITDADGPSLTVVQNKKKEENRPIKKNPNENPYVQAHDVVLHKINRLISQPPTPPVQNRGFVKKVKDLATRSLNFSLVVDAPDDEAGGK